MAPADTLTLVSQLPLEHPWPGLYHLLLELRYRSPDGQSHTTALAVAYQKQRRGLRDPAPLLVIDGHWLEWQRPPEQSGTFLDLTVSANAFFELAEPTEAFAKEWDWRKIPGRPTPANASIGQLALLKWLGDDGHHYSRIIPFELQTDAYGQLITSDSATSRTNQGPSSAGVLVTALALLLALFCLLRQESTGSKQTNPWAGRALVAAGCLWLASYLAPELWLSHTWPTGGDLASHVLYAERFRGWFFAGQLGGWMPEVFGGFPAFRLYFPAPFAVISVLSLPLGLQAAIKLVVVLPSLLLPAAMYWMGGRFKWAEGSRVLAAVGAMAFLVHDGNAIWGGNLRAALAGEFAYSFGLLLLPLFWGSLAWALRGGGRRWIAPCLLQVLIGMSHGYALLLGGFSALLIPLFFTPRGPAMITVLRVHLVSFLLLGIWLIPLIENLPYTVPNDSAEWQQSLNSFLPASLRPMLLFLPLLLAALLVPRLRHWSFSFFVLVALLALLGYAGGQRLGLADIRLFPPVQLCLVIALGAAAGQLASTFLGAGRALWLSAVAALLLANSWLGGMQTLQTWARWDFEGYEGKRLWPEYQALANALSGELDEPRILFEHDPRNNDFGSTRALEALPLFGTRPVLEGLYMEAAITGPFVYQLQAEVSTKPSSPLARFPAIQGTAAALNERLAAVYADTVIVRSKEQVAALAADPAFERLGEFGPLTVFRSHQQPELVSVLPSVEGQAKTRDWLREAHRHFILQPSSAGTAVASPVYGLADLTIPNAPEAIEPVQIVDFERQRLQFRTAHPGLPHLVKIAWHPGWRSTGGEALYPSSPTFMIIIPDSEDVELVFGKTAGQHIGLLFSLAGMLLLLLNPLAAGPAQESTQGRWWLLALALLCAALLANHFHVARGAYRDGHIAMAEARYAAAAAYFEHSWQARRVSSQRAEALFWAARCYQLAGQLDVSWPLFETLIEEHPASFWAVEGRYRLASGFGQDRIAQSKGYADELTRLFPGNQWARQLEASAEAPQ
ncbi:MAG: 6-pyruvoyl-tetrahydropterin synthase-related protein [Pseudomonadota bacterium]